MWTPLAMLQFLPIFSAALTASKRQKYPIHVPSPTSGSPRITAFGAMNLALFLPSAKPAPSQRTLWESQVRGRVVQGALSFCVGTCRMCLRGRGAVPSCLRFGVGVQDSQNYA